jgi:prevent-host-death family protein
MERVGVRELKMRLSHHLKRVRKGQRLVVTERGRPVAMLVPAEPASDLAWLHRMVAEGRADWSGGKPTGASRPIRLRSGPTIAETVLEDRR